jgi:trimethylamine--corrinoid protein Co-methyltransferase
MLSDWRNYESWAAAGSREAADRATDLWQQALAEYEEPTLDPAIREELEAYVARRKEEIGAGDP